MIIFNIFNITIRRSAAYETEATIIFFFFRAYYSNHVEYSTIR